MAFVKLLGNGLPSSPQNFVNMALCAPTQTTPYLLIAKVTSLWLSWSMLMIVLTDNDTDACKQFKVYLNTCFSIKDLGL